MKKLISRLRAKLVWLLKTLLSKLMQLIVLHPWVSKGPWTWIKRYFPRLHQLCRKILRRLNIIGAEPVMQRVRGGQEHALSPLAQRILADLESAINVQPKA